MREITPMMRALHQGHSTKERLECIDNMIAEGFKKDTKDTIAQAFYLYRNITKDFMTEKEKKEFEAEEKLRAAVRNFTEVFPDAKSFSSWTYDKDGYRYDIDIKIERTSCEE